MMQKTRRDPSVCEELMTDNLFVSFKVNIIWFTAWTWWNMARLLCMHVVKYDYSVSFVSNLPDRLPLIICAHLSHGQFSFILFILMFEHRRSVWTRPTQKCWKHLSFLMCSDKWWVLWPTHIPGNFQGINICSNNSNSRTITCVL